jgi:hypothetical protein
MFMGVPLASPGSGSQDSAAQGYQDHGGQDADEHAARPANQDDCQRDSDPSNAHMERVAPGGVLGDGRVPRCKRGENPRPHETQIPRIWRYGSARGGHPLVAEISASRRAEARGYRYGVSIYAFITLLAFINPYLSLAGFGLFAAYWALPISGPTTAADRLAGIAPRGRDGTTRASDPHRVGRVIPCTRAASSRLGHAHQAIGHMNAGSRVNDVTTPTAGT